MHVISHSFHVAKSKKTHTIIIKSMKGYANMKKHTVNHSINNPQNKEIHLFAAANTKDGFVSFFDKAFNHDDTKKLYILKGGPGCGKSTIMKNYGKAAEKIGMTPIYYHCSSDPDSLDGVTVKETGISIIDGTAPHVFDPVYPGVRDYYVDLSCAWDKSLLEKNKGKIISLANQKSNCYKTAYRLLNAAGKVTDEMYETAKNFIDHDKIQNFVKRFTHKYIKTKNNKSGYISEIITDAISAKGIVRYFTLEKSAKTLFFIKNSKMSARFLFDELTKTIKKSGASAIFALSPENPDNVIAILLPDNGICISLFDVEMFDKFEASGKTVKIINSARFIIPESYKSNRQKYRFAEKCYETLRNAALSELSGAGAFHAELEKLYISATDYNKVNEIEKTLY